MKKIVNGTILVLVTFIIGTAFAQDVVKVEAEGTSLVGDDSTMGQAKAAALNNARRTALEKATGVEVRGSSTVYNFQLINDLVHTATRGIIVKETLTSAKCRTENDMISCSVKIEAWVKPLHTERRGSFKITSASVHRPERKEEIKSPVFQNGDEIHIHAAANQDAYYSLFSVDQVGGISRIYPNEYAVQERMPGGKELVFPDDTVRQGGVKLRVRTPKGRKTAVESVMVIATKEKAAFLEARKDQDLTITDLMKELSEMDISQWVEQTVGYEVRE